MECRLQIVLALPQEGGEVWFAAKEFSRDFVCWGRHATVKPARNSAGTQALRLLFVLVHDHDLPRT